ncbi:MAG: hypothetical protein GY852_01830 [bacterium]|nr:hypothetical protein [bacterium]
MGEAKYKLNSAAWSALKIDLATADPPIKPGQYNVESSGFFTTTYEITTSNERMKQLIQQQEHQLLAGEPQKRGLPVPEKKGNTFKMDMDVILVSSIRQDLKKAGFWEGEDYVFAKPNGETVSPFIHDSDEEQKQVDRIIVKNPELKAMLEQPGNSTRFSPQQTAQLEPQQKEKKMAKRA